MAGRFRTSAGATARANARQSAQSASGTSGTTTCSPRPPVVFTKQARSRLVSSFLTSFAASTTASHPTRSPLSRSITMRSGCSSRAKRAFHVCISSTSICTRPTSAGSESTIRYSPILVFSRMRTRRVAIVVPWRTLLKIIAAAALVWLWLQLVQVVLVIVVAVLLAVTLNPIVEWFERRRLPRWAGSVLVGLLLLAVVGGFLWMTWTSLSWQARYVVEHFSEFE